jgi:hypothetical protein
MSELDKTIEELEAEVLAELEEAEDPTKKGAAPAQKSDLKDDSEDTGAAVVDPMQKDAPAKKVAAKAKEISGDEQQKGEGAPDKMKKVKEGYTEEEIRELCHSKDHDCATVIEHPEWGLGKPVHGSHAIPDDEGNVEWYDVQFKHGVEEKVMAEDVKVLVSEAHHEDMDMPKTKDALMAAMHKEMKGMKKKDLQAAYGSMMKMGMHDEETKQELKALEDAKAEIEEKIKSISVKEDVDALTEGEELSEEFKEKAATVFEAAVKSKMRSEVERISEAYQTEKDQEMETFKEELTEKVDTYLNYVVEEWSKENELAIERGLKGEIAEDFISGLKQLFEDHYIDVPDEKYDVLEAQSEKIAELEERLNEEIGKNVEMTQANSELVREQVIAEVSEDLADTEIEKFKSLVEDVEYTDEESFKEKVSTIKESYFPKTTTSSEGAQIDDEQGSTAQDVDTTDAMKRYMSAISRDHKASA